MVPLSLREQVLIVLPPSLAAPATGLNAIVTTEKSLVTF